MNRDATMAGVTPSWPSSCRSPLPPASPLDTGTPDTRRCSSQIPAPQLRRWLLGAPPTPPPPRTLSTRWVMPGLRHCQRCSHTHDNMCGMRGASLNARTFSYLVQVSHGRPSPAGEVPGETLKYFPRHSMRCYVRPQRCLVQRTQTENGGSIFHHQAAMQKYKLFVTEGCKTAPKNPPVRSGGLRALFSCSNLPLAPMEPASGSVCRLSDQLLCLPSLPHRLVHMSPMMS